MTQQLPAGLGPAEATRLAAIELATRFTLDGQGRIVAESPPDGSAGPLMYLAGAEPNLVAFGHEVPPEIVERVKALVAGEAPLRLQEDEPVQMESYLRLLAPLGPVKAAAGLSFLLPHHTLFAGSCDLVSWGAPEGAAVEARLARDGMTPALAEMGFGEVADLWPPWCAAMADGEIASLAFCSRLTPAGAELGLVTLPALRGRGLAAAATAGWSALPALAGRTLFYSTARSNLASQRVAAKLGLAFIGPTWEIVRA